MLNNLLILTGKTLSLTSKLLKRGNGSTWPGHIALSLNKQFTSEMIANSSLKVILIVGTNGKTTTSKMITEILKEDGKKVFQNTSGANLQNGIASTMILSSTLFGKIDKEYGIFEVDENALPHILKEITPHAIIVLNLFRDQLDRYGEIDSIAKRWKETFEKLPPETLLLLNGDDPQIVYLGEACKAQIQYFGLAEKQTTHTLQHAADSIYCPHCHTKLAYQEIYYSHLGNWSCPSCKRKRPQLAKITTHFPLPGTYNKYNTLAAVLFAQNEKLNNANIDKALHKLKPAFGRQEIVKMEGKKIQLFLAKNPTSFNQTLETIHTLGAKYVLLVLNDRIPDGRDVSWIWDIDFEEYLDTFKQVSISGDRIFDMALRIAYSQKSQKENSKITLFENLEEAVKESFSALPETETLYILPTYSAMLDVRKILTGKKIL